MGSLRELPGARGPAITQPAPIGEQHDVAPFCCGKPPLDDWLRHRALKSEGPSARTYVVCQGRTVIGYYCLATGGASRSGVPGKLRRNMPDPIPMMVLGRLAVDRNFQGRKIGGALLRDAMKRSAEAHKLVGFRALTLHAKDDDARAFYIRYGFLEFPQGTKTMFIPIETIIAAL